MNPWSRAESMEGMRDEARDRALFEGRARALPPAKVPALTDVLRAADASREGESVRNRVAGALLAAAACFAAVTGLPRSGASSSAIAGDDCPTATMATATSDDPSGAGMCEAERRCENEEALASSDDSLACVAPERPSFTPAAVAPRACTGEMSCAIATP